MRNGLTIYLQGNDTVAVARELGDRLVAVGHRVEIVDERLAQRIGSLTSRTLVCEVLIRNGVIVLVTTGTVPLPDCDAVVHEVDPSDPISAAAERALAALVSAGVGDRDRVMSGSRKNTIPQPLAHLGYVK